MAATTAAPKRPARDNKRRASHSQIERRRREKINGRLVTLRTIVPACAAELEERRQQRLQEEDEARRIAAGEVIAGTTGESGGKRRRKRRRAAAVAAAVAAKDGADSTVVISADREDELGLHKLEVLTHTIEYIYQLEARLHHLETGQFVQARRIIDAEDDSNALVVHHGSGSPHQVRALNESPVPFAFAPSTSTSPMFGATGSSIMSLSGESPLLRWNSTSTAATTPRSSGPAAATPHDWQAKNTTLPPVRDLAMLPSPSLPLPLDGRREEGRAQKKQRCDVIVKPEHRDAELLLALKTSPDALQPVSEERPHVRRGRASLSGLDWHSAGPRESFPDAVLQSAPGGARPYEYGRDLSTSPSRKRRVYLPSPPLFSLDERKP